MISKHPKFILISAIVLPILLALSCCTGLSKLSKEEYLFTGGEVEFKSGKALSDKPEISNQLNGLIIPEPNGKLLWMRPFLAIHNMVGEPEKEKGLKYWLKYKLGSPPVLLRDVTPGLISDAMVNRLENQGHFNAGVDFQITKKKKTAGINFNVDAGKFYTIRSLDFPPADTQLSQLIGNSQKESLIDTGSHYDLNTLTKERERIDKWLKNRGYFYFAPDYLIFIADTMAGNQQIDMKLRLKQEMPADARRSFRYKNIYVHDDYSLEGYDPDTLKIGNYYYLTDNNYFNPETVLEAVFMYPDSLYSRDDHYNSLRHLMGLGIYKFANARFGKSDTANGYLNANLLLTPHKKMSLSAEMSYALKTNNFAGPGLELSFNNRNTFRRAELLSVNLGGRFETQYSGRNKGQTSYEVTLDASLSIPRFVPFRFQKNLSKAFVPKTVFSIGGGIYSRIDLYELNSFNISLGYNWRSSERISHDFKPVDVSFTKLVKSSEEFEDYLEQSPVIRRSFDEQFILGNSYTFIYSTLHMQGEKRNTWLASFGVDLAGNMASLVTRLTEGARPSPESQHLLLGVPYSQFVRFRNEWRYFHRLNKSSLLAGRIIAGVGLPYGNSNTMPYIKQFFVGGTNSVRAFQARTVGPGTYNPPDTLGDIFLDQTGDIKLETSLEYRFDVYRFIKGALFADAGNIWLNNADSTRPGAGFSFNSFYKQLAVGSGMGIRFDFDFVVIRFDLAFPLRKPYLPPGDRWVFDKIAFGRSSWRKDNLIINIAIGYPF